MIDNDRKINWANIKYTGREIQYALDAVQSTWIAGGSYIKEFEKKMSQIYGGSAFSVSNGTAALQLAFQALDLKPGDKVVVPSFCFQAASNVLIQLGAEPIHCDVEESSWNQSLKSITDVYEDGIVGVVVVYNYGGCDDIGAISSWCKENGIWLVEDCAEAWFSRFNGSLLGSFGDIATFSMHSAKTITCGEGGVLVSNSEELNESILQLRSHGLVGCERPYKNKIAGNNYRLSNIHAAIALAQLQNWETVISSQRERQNMYTQILAESKYGILQKSPDDSSPDYWAIGFRLNLDQLRISRDELMDQMSSHGIDTRPGFYSVSYLDYVNSDKELQISDTLSREIIVLPCGTELQKHDIEYVCRTMSKILASNAS